jgi:protein phosphatase
LEEIRLTPKGDVVLIVAGHTDVGRVRQNNEDSFGFFPGDDPDLGSLLVVADGMGGAAHGEVASRLAVDTVARDYFSPGSGSTPGDSLEKAIEAANAAIYMKSVDDPRLEGMGTTCTAVAVVARELWFGHVGDSRAYLGHGGELTQITRDHSLAAEFEARGGRGEVPARAKNYLTRCLGVKEDVEVDVSTSPIPLADESIIVLCSDGLSNQVQPGEIHELISRCPPDSACRRLIRLAIERGGPDNITVQVARVTAA